MRRRAMPIMATGGECHWNSVRSAVILYRKLERRRHGTGDSPSCYRSMNRGLLAPVTRMHPQNFPVSFLYQHMCFSHLYSILTRQRPGVLNNWFCSTGILVQWISTWHIFTKYSMLRFCTGIPLHTKSSGCSSTWGCSSISRCSSTSSYRLTEIPFQGRTNEYPVWLFIHLYFYVCGRIPVRKNLNF